MTNNSNKKILVTAAWPYVYTISHIGNILCFFSADAIARYYKANGYEVEFVSGSDEHGSKIEFEAKQQGIEPQELVDKYHRIVKNFSAKFGISFTNYSRTSGEHHKKFVQQFYKKVYDNGYINFKKEKQLYCENDSEFLPDSNVVGICPHCDSDHAQGNQCDECGRVLEPTELKDPKCKLCGATPIVKEIDSGFLNLPKLEPEIKKWADTKKHWDDRVMNFTQRWFEEGLNERAITREIKWGIPAPFPELKNKTIYVWAEAVLGYLSAVDERGKLNDYWKKPIENIYMTMGKDNIPFHTIIFPALLMAHGGYELPNTIISSEYLGIEGKQFSKSQNRGIWINEIDGVLEPDYWRYYLFRIYPETKDSDFNYSDFEQKINTELVANIANFVNRVASLLHSHYGGRIPQLTSLKEAEKGVVFKIKETREEIKKYFEIGKIRAPLEMIMKLGNLGNEFLQSQEPWKNEKNMDCLATCAVICKAIAIYIEPYLPFTARKIFDLFNMTEDEIKWERAEEYFRGKEINKPIHLFRKINGGEIKQQVQENRDYGIFKKVDFRVAKIKEVNVHPNADKMYVIKLDLGKLGEKQICSAIRGYFRPEEIKGKLIVVVNNLKPADLRGVRSEAMLLASDHEGKMGLAYVKNGSAGDSVYLEGVDKEPVNNLDFKEFTKLKLVVKVGRIMFKDKMLKTDEDDVLIDIAPDGSLVH